MFIRILATSRDEIGNKIQGRATTKSLTGRLGSGHNFLTNKTGNFRVIFKTIFCIRHFSFPSKSHDLLRTRSEWASIHREAQTMS